MRLFGQLMVAGWIAGWAFIGWVVFINLLKGGYFRDWWIAFSAWNDERGGNPYWMAFLVIVGIVWLTDCCHG